MWLSGGLSAVSVTVMNLSLSCSQTAAAVACLVSGGREASGIAHEVPSLLPSVLSPFMPSCISIQVPFLDEVEGPDMSGHKVKQRHQPISQSPSAPSQGTCAHWILNCVPQAWDFIL